MRLEERLRQHEEFMKTTGGLPPPPPPAGMPPPPMMGGNMPGPFPGPPQPLLAGRLGDYSNARKYEITLLVDTCIMIKITLHVHVYN